MALIWIIAGCSLMLLELIIPGAIVIFLGLVALIVGIGIKTGYLDTVMNVWVTFAGASLFFLIFVRNFFLKYFEGNSTVHNVDEEKDIVDSIVEVAEDIFPYKEGRVLFRGSSWQARSDSELKQGSKAIILKIDGNILIVKSIEE